jgi:hypothetical protein
MSISFVGGCDVSESYRLRANSYMVKPMDIVESGRVVIESWAYTRCSSAGR